MEAGRLELHLIHDAELRRSVIHFLARFRESFRENLEREYKACF